MKYLFFFLLSNLLGVPIIFSQNSKRVTFIDTINVTNDKEILLKIRNSLIEKGVPDDVIEGYISNFFNGANPFLQTQERVAYVYQDSTIIHLNYIPNKNFETFQMSMRKLVYRGGVLYKYTESGVGEMITYESDSSHIFTPTNNSKRIYGYECDEFLSLDSIYRVWINKGLSPNINPGIVLKNISGAVLGFEAKKGNAITKSTLYKIEEAGERF